MTLHLGEGLTLPDELAGDTMAILARKGAGPRLRTANITQEEYLGRIEAALISRKMLP